MTAELSPGQLQAEYRALYEQIPSHTAISQEELGTPGSRIGYLYGFFGNAERRANSEHLQILTSRFTGLLTGVKITPIFHNYLIDKFLGTYRVGKKQYDKSDEEGQRDSLYRMYTADLTSDECGIFGVEGAVYEVMAFNMEYDAHMTFVSVSQGLSYRQFKMHRRELEFTLEYEKRPEELGSTSDLAIRRERTKKFKKDLKKERKGLRKWAEEFEVIQGYKMPIVVERKYPYSDL